MKPALKYGLLAVGLLAAGGLRKTWEKPLERELIASGLLTPPISQDSRERIGQTSAAVALGGLRTLVATFLNLRATTYFTERRWSEVAETYDTIVNLAPHTRYYWLNASWNLANNAASDYRWESPLAPMRRREAWRQSIERGRGFLERGIANNPDDAVLWATLGRLHSDPGKLRNYPAAVEAFRKAIATGDAPARVRREVLYSLARCPGKEKEALALARELYENPANRVTTLVALLFVLEEMDAPSKAPDAHAIRLFGGTASAYQGLKDYWFNIKQRYPMNGVTEAIQGLEWRLMVPEAQSALKVPIPADSGEGDWFSSEE